MDLITPVDHSDAYLWAAVALAHVAIGLALVAALAALGASGTRALVLVFLAYLAVWELGVQGLGAGWPDALTDTAMVASGAALGLLAWRRNRFGLAAVLAGVAVLLWHGIGRRK